MTRLFGARLLAGLLVAAGWALLVPAGVASAQAAPMSGTGTLSATAAPATVTYGSTSTLSGVLTDTGGVPVAGAPVVAEAQTAGGTWVVVGGPVATDAAGAVAVTLAPAATSVVRLRHDDAADGAASPPVTVGVQALLTAALERAAVRVGRPVELAGVLAPAPSGAVVRLERKVAGSWRKLAAVPVAADGTWSTTVAPVAAGFERYRAVRRTSAGVLEAVVALAPLDIYRLHRYVVATRGRVTADLDRFRAEVAAVYADPRGWRRAHHRFREVRRGGDFTVVLAQAEYLPTYSSTCSSFYSCRVGRFVILNQDRWRRGSPYFPGDLSTYRRMVTNHETGHWLGRGHASCPGVGQKAPVMQQQSKGLDGCRVNSWPLPREIRAVS